MKLYLDGITRNTENPNVISDLRRAGYKEVKEEPGEIQAQEKPVQEERSRKVKDSATTEQGNDPEKAGE